VGHRVPWNTASHLTTLLLVPVLDIWGHNLSTYQFSFPFVSTHMYQDFSGIQQNKADVTSMLMCLPVIFTDRVISE
jgi:hypothetical protein